MVGQPAFQYINKLVVAARISGQDEESWIDQVANRVINNTFHHLAIAELKPHPDTMNNGRAGVEVDVIANWVPLEAVDIEDSLDVFDGDDFDFIRIETTNPEGLEGPLRGVAEQLFDGVPCRRLQIAFDGSGAELDHYLFRLGCIALDHEWRAFFVRPSRLPDSITAAYSHDPKIVAKNQSQFCASRCNLG